MTRVDPFRGFRFLVEIDGITSGGFARVKGLSREVKFESYREGGVNEYEHKLAGQVAFPALVLALSMVVYVAAYRLRLPAGRTREMVEQGSTST